jgi:hypothetical protein
MRISTHLLVSFISIIDNVYTGMTRHLSMVISRLLISFLVVIVIITYNNNLIMADIALVTNIVEAQTEETTTFTSRNDTRETTSAEANRSRLEGSQPDAPPIRGTGIPNEETAANPAPQAPISGMEVRAQENETREGTGAFSNFTNTTR